MSAAVGFLVEAIGVSIIWYHDSDTGARIKRINWSKPPRSIYSSLPRSFCFEKTSLVPAFIVPTAPKDFRRRLKRGQEAFWRMDATRTFN